MKNLSLLFVLLIAFVTPIVAAPILDVAVASKGKTISLTFLNKKSSSIASLRSTAQKQKVILKDLEGVTLYNETVNTSIIPKKFYNLDELPSGDYVFEVHEDAKVLLKPFKIIKDEIILKKETTIFKPTIIFKDNIASINLLTLNKSAQITIIDAVGEELYSEKLVNISSFGKRFDFNTIEKGTYNINTFIAGQNFTQTIIVK